MEDSHTHTRRLVEREALCLYGARTRITRGAVYYTSRVECSTLFGFFVWHFFANKKMLGVYGTLMYGTGTGGARTLVYLDGVRDYSAVLLILRVRYMNK